MKRWRGRLSVTNSEENFAKVSTKCPSCHQSESEEVWTNTTIYTNALHVIGGQRLIRIAPPSLLPHHSGTATKDFQSSTSVEVRVSSGGAEPHSCTNTSCPLGTSTKMEYWWRWKQLFSWNIGKVLLWTFLNSYPYFGDTKPDMNFCAVLHHLWGMQIHLKIVIMRPFSFLLLGAAALNNPWSETPAWEKENRVYDN